MKKHLWKSVLIGALAVTTFASMIFANAAAATGINDTTLKTTTTEGGYYEVSYGAETINGQTIIRVNDAVDYSYDGKKWYNATVVGNQSTIDVTAKIKADNAKTGADNALAIVFRPTVSEVGTPFVFPKGTAADPALTGDSDYAAGGKADGVKKIVLPASRDAAPKTKVGFATAKWSATEKPKTGLTEAAKLLEYTPKALDGDLIYTGTKLGAFSAQKDVTYDPYTGNIYFKRTLGINRVYYIYNGDEYITSVEVDALEEAVADSTVLLAAEFNKYFAVCEDLGNNLANASALKFAYQEYEITGAGALATTASDGADLGPLSKVAKLTIPAKAKAPKVTVDYAKSVFKGAKATMEYAEQINDVWKTVSILDTADESLDNTKILNAVVYANGKFTITPPADYAVRISAEDITAYTNYTGAAGEKDANWTYSDGSLEIKVGEKLWYVKVDANYARLSGPTPITDLDKVMEEDLNPTIVWTPYNTSMAISNIVTGDTTAVAFRTAATAKAQPSLAIVIPTDDSVKAAVAPNDNFGSLVNNDQGKSIMYTATAEITDATGLPVLQYQLKKADGTVYKAWTDMGTGLNGTSTVATAAGKWVVDPDNKTNAYYNLSNVLSAKVLTALGVVAEDGATGNQPTIEFRVKSVVDKTTPANNKVASNATEGIAIFKTIVSDPEIMSLIPEDGTPNKVKVPTGYAYKISTKETETYSAKTWTKGEDKVVEIKEDETLFYVQLKVVDLTKGLKAQGPVESIGYQEEETPDPLPAAQADTVATLLTKITKVDATAVFTFADYKALIVAQDGEEPTTATDGWSEKGAAYDITNIGAGTLYVYKVGDGTTTSDSAVVAVEGAAEKVTTVLAGQ